ncbi:MAG: non-ribosomal peptide synthetase [Proteobacteria bacterium]|nr:non-ribosomal peptide synthetase [Pseudomonadota bacterium]
MMLHDSLTHILRDARDKEREIRFIDGDKDESTLSFSGLWDNAVELLGALQNRGMAPGDELVIFTKSNRQFVVAFWAAVLGGIVPVPVAVGISDEHRLKLFRILTQLQRGTLYTEHTLHKRLLDYARPRDFVEIMRKLKSRSIIDEDAGGGHEGEVFEPSPEDTAFIQYSSGSTSDPKGVCLTHYNLTTNIRAIIEGTGWGSADQALSWMPLTHDMGLIGFHLSVLAAGMNHAVMDTSVFVRRPLLWMSKASELEATQLCSPNFGYKHFLKLFQRKGLDNLDLSPVRLILNGAEPISWELCEEFLNALAPFGLRRTAMLPVYGLAEATVAVTISTPDKEYGRIIVDRHNLRIGAPFKALEAGAADAVSFIKVGPAVRDCAIRITDNEDAVLEDGLIGNIQVSGASVTKGLYDDDAAAAEMFTDDRWLRTGDCGVIVDGELVITGRSKDIIIVNGQNYYPHDIEDIVAQVDGLDLGKVVVCGVTPASSKTEELVIFVVYRQDVDSFKALASAVRDIVGEHAGLEVDHVIPVTRIPKTTSGKVQRVKLAGAYIDGEFNEELRALSDASDAGDDLDDDPLVREIELICREFSKEREIGPDDNLFEVGVSSLTLTEIVLAIDERHPGKVDISDLFDYPTIRELADFIRR